MRSEPNGPIMRTLTNGFRIRIRRIAVSSGKTWVYVADNSGGDIGWVFRPYVTCTTDLSRE